MIPMATVNTASVRSGLDSQLPREDQRGAPQGGHDRREQLAEQGHVGLIAVIETGHAANEAGLRRIIHHTCRIGRPAGSADRFGRMSAATAGLFAHVAVGPGDRLEPLVWDRLAAHDRDAERALLQPGLGLLDRLERLPQVARSALSVSVCSSSLA